MEHVISHESSWQGKARLFQTYREAIRHPGYAGAALVDMEQVTKMTGNMNCEL